MVKEGKDGKTGNKGIAMMFVRYPANRETDSVRMWNPDTNGVVTSRDVIWLKRMFFENNVKAEQFNMSDDDDKVKVKVKATDESENLEEEEEDRRVPDLVESAADDDVDDADVESAAGETNDDNADTTQRSGRTIQAPARLTAQVGGKLGDFQGTVIEMNYLGHMAELDNVEVTTGAVAKENIETSFVGAGVGGGFDKISELKVMNYREAMGSPQPQAAQWKVEVKNEKERFEKFDAVTVVKLSQIPKGTKIMSTVWAMKNKPSGKLRGRLNVRGYEQIEGKSYYSDSIAAPVTNANSVRVVWVLMATCPE